MSRNEPESAFSYYSVITLLSLALLRNNYFKMSSEALSNIVYNFEIFIVHLLRQIVDDYRMILH